MPSTASCLPPTINYLLIARLVHRHDAFGAELLVHTAARGVGDDPADRVRRRQLIATGLDRLRQEDPVQLEALSADLQL